MKSLSSLYANVQQGFISVVCISPMNKKIVASGFFAVTDLVAAEAFSKTHAKRNQVYHSFHVLGAEPETGRGAANDFVASIGVFLDVDIKQDDASIHAANEKLPSSLEEVMALIDNFGLPKPTSILGSGNGYYFQFYFREPFLYPSEAQRLQFQAASKGFHEAFAKAWSSRGWTLDNVSDLPRITRMPGTLNHKTNPPKPVELVEHHPERTLSHADFFKFAGKPSSGSESLLPALRRLIATDPIDEGSANADFRTVLAACRAVRYFVGNAEHLSYNEWFALSGIVKHCKDGEQIFHEISQRDPRYDPDLAAQIFRDVGGPITCKHVSDNLGCTACGDCPFAGNKHVGSPITFGDMPEAQAQLMSNFVYATLHEKFFRLDNKQGFTKANINDEFMRYVAKPIPTLLGDKRMRIVHKAGYFPGQTDLFIHDDDQICLNIWRQSDLVPVAGDVSIIMEHFEYLVPDAEERRHVLDLLAHAVQRPSQKIGHCLFFIGEQGTGKSWISDLLRSIFGTHNVFVTDNQMLTSSFNAPMGNRQVLILEEVGLADKSEAYNALKMWVSDEKVTVNEKNVPQYSAATPRLMLAYSNRDLPLKIEDTDRRFMFVQSPSTPRDTEYYNRLFEGGLGQAGAFLQLLLDRDIRHFSAKARPPMTETKQKIINESKTAVSRVLEEMLAQDAWPLSEEIFSLDDVMTEVRDLLPNNANRSGQEFSKVLHKLGYAPVSKNQVRFGSYKYRFWTKVGSKWEGADSEFLKKQWEKQNRAA